MKYIIKIWETERHRDIGESDIIESNLNNIGQAIEKAKKIMKMNNYASLEVQNTKENKTLYFCTPKEEKYFEDEIKEEANQEKINKYAKLVWGDTFVNNGDEIYGKVKDVIQMLIENTEYCNTPEANIDEETLKIINKSTKHLLSEFESNFSDEDYVRLIENVMDGTLNINNRADILEDLEEYYLEEIENMELKDINIKDVVECYFDSNEIENLMEYGADRDSYTIPTISSIYIELLNILNVEYENIFTEDISDGKYISTIIFNEENKITINTNASNTYEQVTSNIESIKDEYIKLQNNLESNNIEEIENNTELELE